MDQQLSGTGGDIEALVAFFERHARVAVLTGAGVSTASGIPDYRDTSGEWKRSPPMQHQQFMGSHAARQRYWARALVGFRVLGEATPNPAHHALARLEALGHVSGVITQNVDGLHQRAGSREVIDLHGRADRVRCMSCDANRMRHDLHAELARRNPRWSTLGARAAPDGDADLEADFSDFQVPACTRCGSGVWKPDVVFFGDSVPRDTVERAFALLEHSDALLVVGSSLMVFSGFRFARAAAAQAKPIGCLNLGRTRADSLYTLKLEAPVESTLSALAVALDGEPSVSRRPA
ncbi:NAD-dependent protein deacetylase [Halomonas urumqiensis]|uniref:NAD-dependent protein deacetylase n=1 Tax=Halomonas urumqiensis TaxID=1684789 RepID=A0A2N7UKK2_9GAMM|nr:NAD-dependent protein deacetylase [Halomonas urumqiensis]PMR80929.1 NAD-dependent protein deacetylase [Halomonas urumqiensis]PTB02886.1 NAD-dependent protein deacetylase [Halomonas urumqiensis]GHE21411.1 NAD-dependent protein deacetylase [Halomonas urumqiensis]